MSTPLEEWVVCIPMVELQNHFIFMAKMIVGQFHEWLQRMGTPLMPQYTRIRMLTFLNAEPLSSCNPPIHSQVPL